MPYVSCTRDVVSPVRTHRRCRHHKRSHLSRRNAMKPESAAVRLLRKKRHSSVQPRRMHCEPRSKGNQGAAREPSPQKLRRVKAGSRPGTTWGGVRATRGFLLKVPEAREPRTGRQPTTTEADVRPLKRKSRKNPPAKWNRACCSDCLSKVLSG